jgi:chromosomal replication initiator protein
MLEKHWKDIKDQLETSLSKSEYESWIQPIRYVSSSADKLTVSVPTSYNLVWLQDNYLSSISKKLNTVLESSVTIDIIVSPDLSTTAEVSTNTEVSTPAISIQEKVDPFIRDHSLLQHYTFNRFVIGDNNALAHAASLKVANTPGTAYNPLFIYGGVGLGKTHLMHAVGNSLLKKNTAMRIAYVTSEEFVNLFVESIQKKRQTNFRNRFRSLDVLLLDDVQFLLMKKETITELFNTFNALHSRKKQIILTSDRTPKQLQVDGLDDRLASRVGGGLDVEIHKPSFETRRAILLAKAVEEKVLIPNEVFTIMAECIETDIRLLENALSRVIAVHRLLKKEITVEMAKDTLNLVIADRNPKNVSFEDIMRETSNVFRLSKAEIKSKSRTTQINHARQIVMYLSRQFTQMSYTEIASELGKEHPTIISGIKRITSEIAKKPRLKEKFDEIIENLKKR